VTAPRDLDAELAAAATHVRALQRRPCEVHGPRGPDGCEACQAIDEMSWRRMRHRARLRAEIEAAVRALCPPPGLPCRFAAALYELRHAGRRAGGSVSVRELDERLRPLVLALLEPVLAGSLADWIEAAILRAEARGAVQGAADERARAASLDAAVGRVAGERRGAIPRDGA
jgi:hypothetical protein